MTRHVPMTSGGLGSWVTGQRVTQAAKPGDRVTLLFADVKGKGIPATCPTCPEATKGTVTKDDGRGGWARIPCPQCHGEGTITVKPSIHSGEDEDTYRFLAESTAHTIATAPEGVTVEFVTVNEGRDIWQVFHDDRFLGNSRLANCSKFLKQQPAREWLEANCDPADTVVYVGIDWTETHRLPAIVRNYLPYRAEAPLTQEPYLDRADTQAMCEAAGIAIPRLYRAGFAHNNCGGFCVRAGQAQMELLLREHPERFAYHEAKEQELREHLDKDVSILRDRSGGTSTPLTLRRFRERIELQPELFDDLDWGGCGCFVDDGVTA